MIRILAAGVAVTLMAGAAQAQTPESGDAWRRLARADLDAAQALILENHPGAVAELGDDAFRRRLSEGYERARERIAAVDGYVGYNAVLAGFATGFGDEHIWSTSRLRGVPYAWAGLVMTRRGGTWVVAAQDGDDQGLVGARLAACDGEPAEAVAAARLAFRVSAPVEAQFIAHGGFMFVDDGNPFLSRPRTCLFETGDGPVEVAMDWRPVETPRLAAALNAAAGGKRAGFGVHRSGDAWWIAIERLSDEAATVVETFEAQAPEWRDSPALVIDLRGNGGGDSRYGRRLADVIYGADHSAARLRGGSACAALWRASPGNAAHVRAFAARAQDPQTARYYETLASDIDRAIAEGRPFDEPVPDCAPREPEAGPAPVYQGRVFIVTDHACFSSCLLMVRDFRTLGAVHVGEATNVSTRYMEVREIVLPSGLTNFSTLQKVVIGEDADIGPFTPAHVFPGSMADTAALEAWIAGLLSKP
ncbi:MAG: hypothetical protein K0M78_01570 [Brevundimonas sp.]|nr:hypothetical protein [Brevundimonas sp.]